MSAHNTALARAADEQTARRRGSLHRALRFIRCALFLSFFPSSLSLSLSVSLSLRLSLSLSLSLSPSLALSRALSLSLSLAHCARLVWCAPSVSNTHTLFFFHTFFLLCTVGALPLSLTHIHIFFFSLKSLSFICPVAYMIRTHSLSHTHTHTHHTHVPWL